MKILKRILYSFIFVFIAFLSISEVNAHPVDTTSLVLNYGVDNQGTDIPKNMLVGQISANWLQVGTYFEVKDLQNLDVVDYYQNNEDMIINHFKESLTIQNNGDKCDIEIYQNSEIDPNVLFLNGVILNVNIFCNQDISELKFKNDLFYDLSPQQRNLIMMYRGNDLTHDLSLLEKEPVQTVDVSFDNDFNDSEKQRSDPENKSFWDSSRFAEKYSEILNSDDLTVKTGIFLLVLAFAVGFLHGLEGGHSKTILTSLVLGGKLNWRQTLLYLITFTIAHMSDLLIFGLILQTAEGINFSFFNRIQNYAGWLMIFLSTYIFLKAVYELYEYYYLDSLEQNSLELEDATEIDAGFSEIYSFRKSATIAFLSGLAPCLTGWVMLTLLFSTDNTSLILPFTISFGAGIFTVLGMLIFLVHYFKKFIISKVNSISIYIPFVSGLLLIVSSILFLNA